MTDEPRGQGVMEEEPKGANAPVDEDIRHQDLEYNPQLEPKKAKAWLNLLQESESAFENWNDHCDKIDKMYANLDRLADGYRDREFQMFWANIEVIKPSIYAKAPEPVVVTKFKDRRPVYQAAAEVLERATKVAFDLAHIDDVMRLIRNDIVLHGRGVAWCRYESKGEGYYSTERVCIDYKHRRDFLHSLSRCWYEVTWVAGASYLTRAQARERFHEYSGDEYQDADYRVDKDAKEVGGADDRERAKFWEIWDKDNERVVWVSEGCENILDEDKAHMELPDFFPCPQPAYGVVQPGSLIPVPDPMQYGDQMSEINRLTAKIHALTEALVAKGFYPGGSTEMGEAIETAIKINTPGQVLVPISNWAGFGGSKEVIIWMPIAEIAGVIQTSIATRKEIIQDVYQITGLSDIMRGATDARETLGAQQLKSQFGSTRIRDKQQEMVRVARDLVVIACGIITESFDPVTVIRMSQTQLPTKKMQEQQAKQLQEQLGNQQLGLQKAQQLPEFQQLAQEKPEAVQQALQEGQKLLQQGQEAIKKIMARPTWDQVWRLLQDNRATAFILDIETDSTIMIDENTEKQRRAEYMGVLAQMLPQLHQMVAAAPHSAELAGELLKFGLAPFRAGRQLDGAIDNMVEQAKELAGQPRPDDPTTAQNKTALQIEQLKVDADKEKAKGQLMIETAKLRMTDEHAKAKLQQDAQLKMIELKAKQQDEEAEAQQTNLKGMFEREKHQADMIKKNTDMAAARQKGDLAVRAQQMKANDLMMRANDRRQAQQFKQMQPRPQGPP